MAKRKPESSSDADAVTGESSGSPNNDLEGPNNKRPRRKDPIKADDATPSPEGPKKSAAPKYGTKEYWEARYKAHLPGVVVKPWNQNESNVEVDNNMKNSEGSNEDPSKDETSYVVDGVVLSKEALKPGHEWYFTYDELRPLILPLILGDVDNEVNPDEFNEDQESWVEEEEDEGGDGDSDDGGGGDDENEEQPKCDKEKAIPDGGEGENEEQAKSDKETASPGDKNQHLNPTNESAENDSEELNDGTDLLAAVEAIKKPKKVLEVGCGDAPLGTALVSDLTSMQSETGFGPRHVVQEVTCIDYSETVVLNLSEKFWIEKKKKEQEQEQKQSSSAKDDTLQQSQNADDNLEPSFRALDARSLPFSSNRYDLILEKGTLDAMLSDENVGLANCIKIVKEMARVTSDGGAILIVSHLNANETKGMNWLEDVVFRGLKEEFLERQELKAEAKLAKETEEDENEKEYVWSVGVHGGDGKFLDANGEEIEGDVGDAIPIYGPAVYVVRKKGVPASIARELFGKKKKGASPEGEEAKEEEAGQDKEEDDSDEEEVYEMPPVKLDFLTYD
ncbi:hypothetical protein ACHAXR_011574 [Thalassiosira sp. AJA248-18]